MAQNPRTLGPTGPRMAEISCGVAGKYGAASWSISLPRARSLSIVSLKTLLYVDLVHFLV